MQNNWDKEKFELTKGDPYNITAQFHTSNILTPTLMNKLHKIYSNTYGNTENTWNIRNTWSLIFPLKFLIPFTKHSKDITENKEQAMTEKSHHLIFPWDLPYKYFCKH